MNTIEWKNAPYNTKYGSVGGLQLFAITWHSRSEDPNWLMRCELPGHAGQQWKDDDNEVLQALAAELLADWLRRVFGVLPADQEDTAFRAWYEHDATDIGPDLEWCAVEGFEAGWRARAGEQAGS